jgi:hypothetical protein
VADGAGISSGGDRGRQAQTLCGRQPQKQAVDFAGAIPAVSNDLTVGMNRSNPCRKKRIARSSAHWTT